MKILLFSHAFYPNIGGIESISLMFANNFHSRNDVSVIVVTRTNEEGNKKFPFQVVRDPSVVEVIKLLKWCDVVFENNPTFGLSWPNFLIRKPKLVGLQTWITGPNAEDKIQNRLKKGLLGDYNRVVACSEKIKNVTFKNALVIGNPYDSSNFKQTDTNKKSDFIFVGRLVSDKGGDMGIELLNQLHTLRGNKYSLTIIGDGPEMQSLKALAIKYNLQEDIRFLGFLGAEEIVKELNEHKYLLVPSRWEEPFGIVALEGIACGCIPIVSNGGGLPDAVGKAGVVFERNSVPSLVQTTMELLDNVELQDTILAAANNHLQAHTEIAVSEQYFELIRNSLKH
ncbi:glycosyltransferase family 4 protein [Flavobacterium sp. 7A]|uniref:glycosyltransferase family 4 protein n=1 Tax=Flavobacterium sp. 7A TaxID=2940571 RepID=UPI0022263F1A|nr:glycosyltransferase family 4 protein [Flavobacterium sp. 7A]MCW2118495.1 glycosyltransferase involved in cell wall biosynthesis [Flavobacterium sp. 7A]